jgi:hypothetical protein
MKQPSLVPISIGLHQQLRLATAEAIERLFDAGVQNLRMTSTCSGARACFCPAQINCGSNTDLMTLLCFCLA